MNRVTEWRGHAWIGLVFRLYLGGLFLVACVHKIVHPEVFAIDVATYQLLPLWSVNFFALVLPYVELVAGVLLVVGYRTRAAALLVLLMLTSFVVGIIWALHLGLDMSCGCFASQAAAKDDPISWLTVVRDSVWVAQAAYVFWLDRDPIGIERWLRTLRDKRMDRPRHGE